MTLSHRVFQSTEELDVSVDNVSTISLNTIKVCKRENTCIHTHTHVLGGYKLNINSDFVVNLQKISDYMCIYRICA